MRSSIVVCQTLALSCQQVKVDHFLCGDHLFSERQSPKRVQHSSEPILATHYAEHLLWNIAHCTERKCYLSWGVSLFNQPLLMWMLHLLRMPYLVRHSYLVMHPYLVSWDLPSWSKEPNLVNPSLLLIQAYFVVHSRTNMWLLQGVCHITLCVISWLCYVCPKFFVHLIGCKGDILLGSLKVIVSSHFQRSHADVPIESTSSLAPCQKWKLCGKLGSPMVLFWVGIMQ